LLQFDGFLVRGDSGVEPLLLFSRIGLLGGGEAIVVAELEPDQVAAGIHLVGLIQGGDGLVVVASVGAGLGGAQFLVEALDGIGFLGLLGLGLLHRLYLLGRQTLALGGIFLLLLHVKVQGVFIELNLVTIDVVQLFPGLHFVSVLVEGDVVLAAGDAQR